ncbi:hypothetical protein [Desulforhabdus amnigena]|uniref:Uncharacterized protein n=1 Tax=Desulforhabdus amnigena TaxID=40218 RepID=A0A9W6FTP7_9BACT|nr:hypothetical protein [Desulforhabdus amnigena]NLJ26943.1 hypothetical protein [Deltaproteobacteria bacterium]GLI34460.1 hypothetical protein DAMNIGENAA_18930 [Desulforhabdus amnigena]
MKRKSILIFAMFFAVAFMAGAAFAADEGASYDKYIRPVPAGEGWVQIMSQKVKVPRTTDLAVGVSLATTFGEFERHGGPGGWDANSWPQPTLKIKVVVDPKCHWGSWGWYHDDDNTGIPSYVNFERLEYGLVINSTPLAIQTECSEDMDGCNVTGYTDGSEVLTAEGAHIEEWAPALGRTFNFILKDVSYNKWNRGEHKIAVYAKFDVGYGHGWGDAVGVETSDDAGASMPCKYFALIDKGVMTFTPVNLPYRGKGPVYLGF